MITKITFFAFLVFILSAGYSQNNVELLSNNSFFENALQCSGLIIYNQKLYMPAEKCNKLIVTDINGNNPETVSLDFSGIGIDPQSTELEGLALYKNYLFLTDESSQNHRLYYYNLSIKHLRTIESGDVLNGDTAEYGIEGIAVDTTKNTCYVLKEKDGHGQSIIREFNIVEKDESITLEFRRNIYVVHPNNSWRYSDLYFNYDDKYLYCLKTTYGSYQVDTIPTDHLRKGDITIPKEKMKLFMDISEDVILCEKDGYDSNLEGITIYKNQLYVVSDNAKTDDRDCERAGSKKTLLLKFFLN